ncbi:hypothetical protein NDI37_16505 [Funiculus sociatus GB2-A5]|uniref:PEP-CTERM protein-sorting domain-containing protein n=1 Tax=Funiculus sociatus GB2-A5 TaxID=2933946 RepID=A0ABV0JRH0_9CYAN|nr:MULTISPECIES: hypothetical protein [unclassified Trichocoleus]MBD1906048.1 hypothetical protein [Trichocoleus sp. FACHB-832]MBD2061993.1 hypothetical protein [Trichocoleus sp. FACHB-6]
MLKNKSAISSHFYAGLSAIGIVSSVAFASPTLAATATFDGFLEGFSNTTITDDELTFFDLDTGLSPEETTFSIEGTTKDYLGNFFSASNYLTFGGYAEGAEASFGRFGSTRITTGKVESSASLDVFSQLFSPSNNLLTLEAFLDGNLVQSNSVALADFGVIETSPLLHSTLSISGVKFDELRLVASGSDDDGAAFIGIDNVRVGVPEPTSALSVLAFGILGVGSVLKRKFKSAK